MNPHNPAETDPFMRIEHEHRPPDVSQEVGDVAVGANIEIEAGNPEETANYQGNWTNLALSRMSGPDFRQKFDNWVSYNTSRLPDELGMLDRAGLTAAEYSTRTSQFSEALETVGSVVQYGPAESYGKKPSSLGTSEAFGEPAVMFSDSNLSDRQKDIIAAHEMFHSLVDSQGAGPKELVRRGFDVNKIAEKNDQLIAAGEAKKPLKYHQSPDELMARMSQLKNYFGMTGSEAFGQDHLDYARQHYVSDTGLDNSMTLFLEMARDAEFVQLMNELPL